MGNRDREIPGQRSPGRAIMQTVGRNLFVGLTVPLVAVILSMPVKADTDQDQQFLAALKAAGWAIPNPKLAISQANMVCNEGFYHGVTWQEMRSTLVSSYGLSKLDASTLISKAVSVYCPKYSEAIAGIENDVGKPATGPTNADGAEFAKEVRDRGILPKLSNQVLAQTLAAICDTATGLAPYGYGKDYLVSLYTGTWMYPLSTRDAEWLIDAALPKCN
jgi:hypothetical protein